MTTPRVTPVRSVDEVPIHVYRLDPPYRLAGGDTLDAYAAAMAQCAPVVGAFGGITLHARHGATADEVWRAWRTERDRLDAERNVRDQLARIGWTHAEAARRLGLSPRTVQGWDKAPADVLDYLVRVGDAVASVPIPTRLVRE